ncbi:hypothetical protein GXP71_10920 [Cellulomonas sp. H30R-01]|uniref:hypothetical protein n=1 Tax=Cellulomonas sp. H30R-01 TaxID=2704467 RepID=UPI00138BC50A|nr:hypothetical protein [Cellulomonas sp. H30R-01]QHT56535.1 hypothetical protein GXP71_10920 [Cellulomonas sp. H30R-01]
MTTTTPAFPPVPAAVLDRTAREADAAAWLADVDAWRDRARAWVRDDAAAAGVSAPLRGVLAAALAVGGDPAVPSVYVVRGFPPEGLDPELRAWAVLVWRSWLVDYLSDVWDTVGGDLTPAECALVVDDVLTPAGLAGTSVCLDCLQPLPDRPADAAAHAAVCPVRTARARTGTERPSPW